MLKSLHPTATKGDHMIAITDAERRHLHDQAEQAMGEEAGNTLMGYLPPVGWQDVATKADVATLKSDLESLEARLKAEMQAGNARTEARMLRAFYIGTIGLVVALASIPQIAERLFG